MYVCIIPYERTRCAKCKACIIYLSLNMYVYFISRKVVPVVGVYLSALGYLLTATMMIIIALIRVSAENLPFVVIHEIHIYTCITYGLLFLSDWRHTRVTLDISTNAWQSPPGIMPASAAVARPMSAGGRKYALVRC